MYTLYGNRLFAIYEGSNLANQVDRKLGVFDRMLGIFDGKVEQGTPYFSKILTNIRENASQLLKGCLLDTRYVSDL